MPYLDRAVSVVQHHDSVDRNAFQPPGSRRDGGECVGSECVGAGERLFEVPAIQLARDDRGTRGGESAEPTHVVEVVVG